MSAIPKQLEDEAMRLPPDQRARLAARLIPSLDQEPAETNVESLWVIEAQRRAEELANDLIDETPAEQVFANASDRIG